MSLGDDAFTMQAFQQPFVVGHARGVMGDIGGRADTLRGCFPLGPMAYARAT